MKVALTVIMKHVVVKESEFHAKNLLERK